MKDQKNVLSYHSAQSSHPFRWQDTMSRIRSAIEDAVEELDPAVLEQVFSSSPDDEILASMKFEDLEILKFHYASMLSSCADKLEFRGIPKELLQECRHRFYLSCIPIHTFPELSQLFHGALLELIEMAGGLYSHQYSYHVSRAVCYIYRCRYQPLLPHQVAEFLGIDRTYLARIFREETGQTMTQYIRQVKIRRAAELMTTRLYHFTEIAEMLGYQDYSHFCHSFKRVYGVSPRDWIRSH